MGENRPRGREQHIVGQGSGVYKRGDGLGTGPVGSGGRPSGGEDGGGNRGGKRKSPLTTILLLAVLLLGGGGAGLGGLLGGGQSGGSAVTQEIVQQLTPSAGSLGNLLTGSFGSVSTGWTAGSNVGRLNTTVAPGAREKYTNILGNGRDTVTIMVYLCGTDLESKYKMGTADLSEMAAASLSDQVNLIVYTGGCRQWQNNIVSSSVNQIYKVEDGGLRLLEKNAGKAAMTDPANLTDFINYCAKNYPANRMELIFWDHGGGSLSGYGYDEKNQNAGSMSLSGINKALADAGVKFDFIGFDACLMATLENALMLTNYADYLIASEETEPGVGWYYTNWLTELSNDTSMPTVEIGKHIVDDFVSVCAQKCRGQDTTLSVVDLAELSATVPEVFRDFAVDTSELVQGSGFKTVSGARSSTREFAASSKIDQVDLVHLAANIGTSEAKALNDALLGAVKYNKTSSTVTNAYGLSIYFPYQKTGKVKAAAQQYDAIGLDDEYTRCIQQFASMGAAGQSVSSSVSSLSSNPLGALLGAASGSGIASGDLVSQMLLGVLESTLTGGRSLDVDRAGAFLTENQFDSSQLVWLGEQPAITLSEEQWGLVNDLALSVYYDDGQGYIDLGLDNQFSFTDDGALVGRFEGTWLSIDGQVIPYYYLGTVDDGDEYCITGYTPCLVNGERAELLLVFDTENPSGYIAGARSVYTGGETETVAKNVSELNEGDEIDFVCDYYSYGGEYRDSYLFGEPWAYHADAEIGDAYLHADRVSAMYRFTDIYGQNYWTPVIP
ncbi:MAG: peptidase C11 [Oscillospiraceae bacterium]|nr:peptidase C11 [Oscillospiraceae bacterium]